MKKKMNSHGETLVEVLFAMLIMALGSILMVTMMSAATRIVDRGKEVYIKNMNNKNAVEEGSFDSTLTGTATISGGKFDNIGGNSPTIQQGVSLQKKDDMILKYKLKK